jgi:hypothetical protein
MEDLNGGESKHMELSLGLDFELMDRVLGIHWDTKTNTFICRLNFVRVDPLVLELKRIPTKRELLRAMMSLWDPHGYASPVLVHAKVLLQNVW